MQNKKVLKITPPDSDTIDWHKVVDDVATNRNEIKSINQRDHSKNEIIRALESKMEAVERKMSALETNQETHTKKIDGIKIYIGNVLDTFNEKIDKVVSDRKSLLKWIGGIIVTCTIATLTIWYNTTTDFETSIEKRVSSISISVDDRINRLDDKITKSNDKIFLLLKELKHQ
ncbi:MAG: hypothetical protein V3V00_15995 [Saprospiraceae bacterium]